MLGKLSYMSVCTDTKYRVDEWRAKAESDKGVYSNMLPYPTMYHPKRYDVEVIFYDVYMRYALQHIADDVPELIKFKTFQITSYRCFSYNRLRFFQCGMSTEHAKECAKVMGL